MEDRELDDLLALLPALLRTLEALGFIGRHLHPPAFGELMAAVGEPDAALRAERPRLDAWPQGLAHVATPLAAASDAALAAFEALRGPVDGVGSIFRGLRHVPRALEALYPLAADLAPVSRFFLEPASRADTDLQARLARSPPRDDVGVFHVDNEPGSRGGVSIYVPETYTPEVALPLVTALHGGAGNGRSFLWSWLRDARSHGAILIAPTAIGDTWALAGPDPDTPNLARMVDIVRRRWRVDEDRLLLTGMSDGGTFSYVSGLEPGSPFTHLAAIAAAFHPMLAEMVDPARIAGLPIHVAHGALDWMFPVDMARQAQAALSAAGAAVSYVELADLSHTYPGELNPRILSWLQATAG